MILNRKLSIQRRLDLEEETNFIQHDESIFEGSHI